MLSNYWTLDAHKAIWRCPIITVLAFYSHHILKSSKLGSIDSNETMLEGNVIKCDISAREWFWNMKSK